MIPPHFGKVNHDTQRRSSRFIGPDSKNVVLSVFGLFLGLLPLQAAIAPFRQTADPTTYQIFSSIAVIPFVSIGAYLFVGQYFWEAWARNRTWYCLTTKRAIITTNLRTRSLTSWPITKDMQLEYKLGRESKIYFARIFHSDGEGGSRSESVGFEYIADGEVVYQLIGRIQGSAA